MFSNYLFTIRNFIYYNLGKKKQIEDHRVSVTEKRRQVAFEITIHLIKIRKMLPDTNLLSKNIFWRKSGNFLLLFLFKY